MNAENHTVKEPYVLGVDIGGTHITAALVDVRNKCVVEGTQERCLLNAHGTAEEVLESWYRPMQKVMRGCAEPIHHMGLALPGPFDYEGGVALIRGMHKYDSIFGVDVKDFLSRKLFLNREDIQMRNDTEAFLEGEMIAGAGRGYNSALAITLGTGLGAARSMNNFAEDLNLGSSSFMNGIAEDYLSTRWFVKRYRELAGAEVNGVKELLELGREHTYVQQIFGEFSKNLARFLLPFVRHAKPDVVIIGGNIAGAYDLFFPELNRLAEQECCTVKICRTTLGEKAALIGAVSCWM